MAEKKKSKSWGEMSPAEKKAVLVGWVAVVLVAGYFLMPSEEPLPAPPTFAEAPAEKPSPVFSGPSPESLDAATQLLTDLDAAMIDGMDVLKIGDAHAMGAHSRRINALVESAYTNFGSTIFEPLGRCGVASNYARSWWRAQTSAVLKGDAESAPGAIRDALEQFQVNRDDCLQEVGAVQGSKWFECLGSYGYDPETRKYFLKPKPAHCKS